MGLGGAFPLQSVLPSCRIREFGGSLSPWVHAQARVLVASSWVPQSASPAYRKNPPPDKRQRDLIQLSSCTTDRYPMYSVFTLSDMFTIERSEHRDSYQ